ncbi:hypothetical protein [Acetobacter sp. P1H12_c]|uniref:hypothetical protein n=1 Tax=Acetobacter sp. P1H12_c TaxID=2762621 RepID=UPI001C046E3A|nr:hypothetical protein [Acetobacter sp. P1H12_c]
MIKHLALLTFLAAPSFAFAQAVPVRPNHTLPQYSAVTAANSNAGAPRTMLRMAAPSASGGYAALWPPGGIRKDTRVPSLYTDGSAGTLAQIGLMSDGSVQQTDIGTTVAALDTRGMMPAPLSGDASSGTVKYLGGTSFTVADGLADFFNTRIFGLAFDGSPSDADKMSAWYQKIPQGVAWYPAGILWPSTSNCQPWYPKTDHKYILFRSNGSPGYGCNGWRVDMWYKDPTANMYETYANGTLEYGRTYGPNTLNSEMMRLVADNNDPSKKPGEGLSEGLTLLNVSDTMEDGGYGSMHPVYVRMTVKGHNWGQNQHANIQTDTFRTGPVATEGMWGLFQAMNEMNGLGPDTDQAAWSIGDEIDMAGVGTDARHMRNAYRIGLNVTGFNAWSANSIHAVGDLVTDSSQTNVYIATVAGTSGASEPSWNTATINQSTTTDGTVTWMLKNPNHLEIGTGFFAGGGGNSRVNYRTVFQSDAQVTHAVFDASPATLGPSGAAVRLSAGQIIDFSGHNEQNENVRTLGYTDGKGLQYKVAGNVVLDASDNGTVQFSRGITLGSLSTAAILALSSVSDGYVVNDSDLNQPVIYEHGKWYPIQLGAALGEVEGSKNR